MSIKYGITETLQPATADWLNRLHAVLLFRALRHQKAGTIEQFKQEFVRFLSSDDKYRTL